MEFGYKRKWGLISTSFYSTTIFRIVEFSTSEIESFLYKAGLLREKEGPGLTILRLWIFAHDGFTAEAESLMTEKGVLWSDRDDLNGLLAHVGLKSLPDIKPETSSVSRLS